MVGRSADAETPAYSCANSLEYTIKERGKTAKLKMMRRTENLEYTIKERGKTDRKSVV